MHNESGLEQRLQEIRRKFGESLPGKAERVLNLWSRLQSGWCEDLAKSMYEEVHRLYGSCGTLGFVPVSEVAHEIQTLLRAAMETQCLPAAPVQTRITELVEILSGNCGCRDSVDSAHVRVLVVEDDLELASVYSAILREAGMDVLVANPTSAGEESSKFRPDLILLDLTTPTCRRFELAGALRNVPGLSGIPLICLSCEEEPNRLQSQETDWLNKPADPEYLIGLIRKRVEEFRDR